MSEPKRLRLAGGDRVTSLLLDAGHADAPSKARIERMLGGIAGAGAGIGLTAEAAAAAPGALGAAPLAAKSAVSITLVLKWLGLGMLAGAAVSTGALRLPPPAAPEVGVSSGDSRRSVTQQPTQASRHSIAGEATSSTAQPTTPNVATTQAPRDDELHRFSVARTAANKPPAMASVRGQETAAATPIAREALGPALPPGSSPEARALREEVAALGLAKAALNRGAPSLALEAVRAYRARFAGGRLGPEALYIEMEAELALGNRQRALEIAEQLAASATPNAERARAILKGATK